MVLYGWMSYAVVIELKLIWFACTYVWKGLSSLTVLQTQISIEIYPHWSSHVCTWRINITVGDIAIIYLANWQMFQFTVYHQFTLYKLHCTFRSPLPHSRATVNHRVGGHPAFVIWATFTRAFISTRLHKCKLTYDRLVLFFQSFLHVFALLFINISPQPFLLVARNSHLIYAILLNHFLGIPASPTFFFSFLTRHMSSVPFKHLLKREPIFCTRLFALNFTPKTTFAHHQNLILSARLPDSQCPSHHFIDYCTVWKIHLISFAFPNS